MSERESEVAELVRAWQRREPAALDRLLPILRNNLLPLARIILRDEAAAEDAWVEMITDLLRRLDDIAPHAAMMYARRAIRTQAIDLLRSRQVRDIRRAQRGAGWLRNAEPLRSTEPVERVGGGHTDPEGKILKAEARQAIREALACIPEPTVTILRRHLVEGFTLDEVAAELDVSRTTVKRHVRQGRVRLARALRSLQPGGGHDV